VYLLGVDYRGEGYWNLRKDFRSRSPNFTHDSADVSGQEIRAGLSYLVTDNISFEVGYWLWGLETKGGATTTYFADGSTGVGPLDNVSSSRAGFYLALNGHF